MEIRAKDIIGLMDAWAPPSLAESWDHSGLQAGDPDQPVHRLMTALDLTRANLDYAMAHGVDMIVSHHPFLFRGCRQSICGRKRGGCWRICCRTASVPLRRTPIWTRRTAA